MVDSINVPCIIIHGESDKIITLRKARDLAGRLKRCKLYVFRKTGHQIMQEHPRECLHFINKFVDQVLDPHVTTTLSKPVDIPMVPAEHLHASTLPSSPVKPDPFSSSSSSSTVPTTSTNSNSSSSVPHLPPLVPSPPLSARHVEHPYTKVEAMAVV